MMGNDDVQQRFADPEVIAQYAQGVRMFFPGFDDMHRMAALLLAERAPPSGHILVLGAGGGQELKAFASFAPGWRFTGVDPSAEMLELARQTLGPLQPRAELVKGLITDAPEGPFDGATCLLTLHFLSRQERLRTLAELRARLRPGACLVIGHSSFPQERRERWLDRYAAFALASGAPAEQVGEMRASVGETLTLLDPSEEEQLLSEAGFRSIELFYAAFSWRGWVALA